VDCFYQAGVVGWVVGDGVLPVYYCAGREHGSLCFVRVGLGSEYVYSYFCWAWGLVVVDCDGAWWV